MPAITEEERNEFQRRFDHLIATANNLKKAVAAGEVPATLAIETVSYWEKTFTDSKKAMKVKKGFAEESLFVEVFKLFEEMKTELSKYVQ
jgi:hypothetical protein